MLNTTFELLPKIWLTDSTAASARGLSPAFPPPVLEGLRKRNASLDTFFYDVTKISDAEQALLLPYKAEEGAIVVVPPSGMGEITIHHSAAEFKDDAPGQLDTLVVAGVGSSALGTAALARNVADALGKTVVGVVSGYGLADLPFEAMGGYFMFGGLSRLRHKFHQLQHLAQASGPSAPSAAASLDSTAASSEASSKNIIATVQLSPDTHAVKALLGDTRFRFRLLVGHSKGNYVIAEALEGMRISAPARFNAIAPKLHIVNISARSELPDGCGNVINVMGAIDNFGLLNSVPSLEPFDVTPFGWHHTNTELALSLNVTEIIRGLIQAQRI